MKRDETAMGLTPQAIRFYVRTMDLLDGARIPFLVGGAFALHHHTGVRRNTKDLDFFVTRRHVPGALKALSEGGFEVEMTDPKWLAKAVRGRHFVDLIFSSGNNVCPVDGAWFRHSRPGRILDRPVRLCPPEEMIWQKAFIM